MLLLGMIVFFSSISIINNQYKKFILKVQQNQKKPPLIKGGFITDNDSCYKDSSYQMGVGILFKDILYRIITF